MAEPEEHLTFLGAGLSLPCVSTTPTHMQSWDARMPAMAPGLPGGYSHLHWGGGGGLTASPHRYQQPLPSAASLPLRAAAMLKAPDLCCLENTYFPAVSP